VHLVARRGGVIHGIEAVTSIAALPEAPDLVVLAIPAANVEEAVDDSLARGARAIVVIAAGFGEGGEEGRLAQERLVAKVRGAGAVMLGPNCLGLLDHSSGLNASSSEMPAGPVALVSQSGNLALELGMLLAPHGLGFSRFASVGNQADVGIPDVLASLAAHEATRVVTAYVEDPQDGDAFVAAVRMLAEAGKPPLIMKAGRTAIGARAALSHTGALAGSARVFAAAVRDAGGIVVATPGEAVDRARALLGGGRMRGRRVAVVADGGGHGVLAADILTDAGFDVATLAPTTAARIAPHLPNSAPVNPVDLAGAGEQDIWNFARITEALLDGDEVDGVLFSGYFGGYAGYSEEAHRTELDVSRRLAELRDRSGKALIVHSMQVTRQMPAIGMLESHGVPTYARVEDALRGLDALAPRAAAPRRAATAAPQTVLDRPAYGEARDLLAAMGIAFPDGGLARTDDEVGAIVARIGGPVALKAVSADLLHKTDAGGVALGLATPAAAVEGARLLRERVHAARPDIVLDGIFVERMADRDGVDLVIGANRDATFGPVILVGVGGIFVEILDDAVLALAPADPDHLAYLLRGLRAWPLLAGARGARPVDVGAVARAACAVGDLLVGRPDLVEVEVNPLRASFAGILALDARVVLAESAV
jgi:acyl-CoA synthetase (NDP forming)